MLLPKELKYAAIAGGVAVFGLIFGWVLFPVILKGQLKKVFKLSYMNNFWFVFIATAQRKSLSPYFEM